MPHERQWTASAKSKKTGESIHIPGFVQGLDEESAIRDARTKLGRYWESPRGSEYRHHFPDGTEGIHIEVSPVRAISKVD